MSDSSPKPWSIRGITEDTRKIAIDAADRAGLDLGPWVSHAIRQTAQADRGGVVGEVVSDSPAGGASDRPSDSLAVVAALFAGLGQIADKEGCGGVALRARALLDQHMAALALAPLPRRQAAPRRPAIHADSITLPLPVNATMDAAGKT